MKKYSALLLTLFATFTFVACEEVDDQRYAPMDALPHINPEPIDRDFVGNNKKHKILMAVIDTGTDYNHPLIRDNIHFELDSEGRPVGAGQDYLGRDKWPAPYVARTAHVNPNIKSDDEYHKKARQGWKRSMELQKKYPEIAPYLTPERSLEQEQESGAYHGTHVGGLMVYDEPRLGLLIYRVLPVNIVYKDGEQEYTLNKADVVFDGIIKALETAIDSGARVINLSLGLNENRDGGGGLFDHDDGEESLNDFEEFQQRKKKIEYLAKANPDVVFVAAAGNDSAWVDEHSNLQLPCGVKAKNILCVGALNDENRLASFSNVILSDTPFIAAPGMDILSLFPSKMCDHDGIQWIADPEDEYPFSNDLGIDIDMGSDMDMAARWEEALVTKCSEQTGLKEATGTSMASPIIARAVGKVLINNPSLTGGEAIQALFQQAEGFNMGRLPLLRLKVDKPSWYPDFNDDSEILNPASYDPLKSETPKSFHFFAPQATSL